MKRVGIGLLGCGTVGRGFVRLLDLERTRVRNRYGIDLSITRIAVRDLNKPRPGVEQRLLTTSTLDTIQSGEIVVEAIGRSAPARIVADDNRRHHQRYAARKDTRLRPLLKEQMSAAMLEEKRCPSARDTVVG